MSDVIVEEAPIFKIEPEVAAILALPPVKWKEHVDGLKGLEAYDLSDKLMSWSAHIALAAGYVAAREHGNEHAKSVKEAQSKRTKVRRALGYTYPDDSFPF